MKKILFTIISSFLISINANKALARSGLEIYPFVATQMAKRLFLNNETYSEGGEIDIGDIISSNPYLENNISSYDIEKFKSELNTYANNGKIRYKLTKDNCIFYYPTGKVLSKTKIKNMTPISSVLYYPDGNIMEVKNFTNNGADVYAKAFYQNGALQAEIMVKDYKLAGTIKSYYENGNIQTSINHTNGKRDGIARFYYENGNIQIEEKYKYGVLNGNHKEYYENGNLKAEVYYVDDVLNGPTKLYYENGNLQQEGVYKNGLLYGMVRLYYKNGNLQEETMYKEGQRHGFYKIYYENRKLKNDGTFKNDKIHGINHYYYENGQIALKSTYSEGILLSLTAFDENGNELTSQLDITRVLLHFVSLENVI